MIPTNCTLCPRLCGADRRVEPGDCLGGDAPKVASASAHFGEERCLSGSRGSGTVFFSGCSLGCIFCQNHELRDALSGRGIPADQLAGIFLQLAGRGVHNLNLVTPTHYRPWIVKALQLARADGFSLPVVWNTSGYETLESIEALQNDVDIYLYDLKFCSPELSAELADASDYFEVAFAALKAAVRQTGPPVLDEDGIMHSGVLVRMLVLPNHTDDAIRILKHMARELPQDSILLNIMPQYRPSGGHTLPDSIARPLNICEHREVTEAALRLGFKQENMQ